MKDKREALQACPFCGDNEATLESFDVVTDGEAGEFAGVRCNHCGINLFTDGTEEHMIRDWNTRADSLEGEFNEMSSEFALCKKHNEELKVELVNQISINQDYICEVTKLKSLLERVRKPLADFMDAKCASGIGVMIAVKEALAVIAEEGK